MTCTHSAKVLKQGSLESNAGFHGILHSQLCILTVVILILRYITNIRICWQFSFFIKRTILLRMTFLCIIFICNPKPVAYEPDMLQGPLQQQSTEEEKQVRSELL